MDDNESPIPIKVIKDSILKRTNAKGQEVLQFQFSVQEQHLITSKSEVLCAIRLKLDDSMHLHFPYKLHGEERYLGTKLKLQVKRIMLQSLAQHKDVKYATLNALKTEALWN
jgi:hypothetical protein